jgi:lipopolysaccharide assembly protein A
MARLFRFVFYLVIAFLAVFFALLNSQSIQFDYYFGKTELPLALMLAIAMAIGAALGVIASLGMVVKSKRQSSTLRKSVANAEKELAKLRAAPPHQEQS